MSNSVKEKKLKSGRISVKPFVYNIPSISSVSIRIIVLLSLQVIMLGFTQSYSALLVILACLLGALVASSINYYVSKEPAFNVMNILIQGLFIGLLLPEKFPPFTAFVIAFATIAISRCIVFKGINSWINTATVAVIIAWYIGRSYFPVFNVNTESLPGAPATITANWNTTIRWNTEISSWDTTVKNKLYVGNDNNNCYYSYCYASTGSLDEISQIRFVPKTFEGDSQISDVKECDRSVEWTLVYWRDRNKRSDKTFDQDPRLSICICAFSEFENNVKCKWEDIVSKNYIGGWWDD